MRIEGLKKYRGRNPWGYFKDLPWEARRRAQRWLWHFCQRWGRNLPGWRFAILVGQAKRLALNPPTSAWGRSMRAKRGGYAVQRLHRARRFDAAANARLCRAGYLRASKKAFSPGFVRSAVHLEGI